MEKTEKIIIDAEPKDVIDALIKVNNLPANYEVKEFTYSLSKITDKDMLAHMDMTEYKITHCRLELIAKKARTDKEGV